MEDVARAVAAGPGVGTRGRRGARAGGGAAARRGAPGGDGRHRPVLGPRPSRSCRSSARSWGFPCSSTGWLAAACRRTTRTSSRARARHGAQGRGRGARGRRADGLPARLRRLVRRRHEDRGDRLGAARSASTRASRRRSCTAAWPPRSRRCARRRAGTADRSGWLAQLREVENEKRAAEQEDLTDERAPLHPLRVYHELAQVLDRDAVVIGDGGDFVSYAGRVIDTYEPGCWMDPGPVRLPRLRSRLRAGRQARPARQAGLPAARRRRLRLLGHGVRHDGAPRRAGRRRDGQQRHLGAREAPDGVPLRLLGRGRAAAGLPLRRGRARRSAATASWWSARTSCGRRSSARSSRASRRS